MNTIKKLCALLSFTLLSQGVKAVPCNGVPSGQMSNAMPCPSSNFSLYYTDTLATGLTYLWQQSADSISWSNTGTATAAITTSITVPTYFRVIVTCTNSNLSDTSAGLIQIAPFYVCYCNDSGSTNNFQANVGNITIQSELSGQTLFSNGSGVPVLNNSGATKNYSNYTYLPPTVLYLDSLYRFFVTQVTNSSSFPSSPVNIYIDLNRDGIYQASELVFNKTTTTSITPTVTDTFTIPSGSTPGLTGMRVMLQPGGSSPLDPCNMYADGEVEDYVVDIAYDPCDGPANAGTATSSDSTLCPGLGYTFLLSDLDHERLLTGVTWSWEQSPDNGLTWGDIANSTGVDTMTMTYSLPVWYRLRMICTGHNDTTYSNIVKVSSSAPSGCYCYSNAVGGSAFDSTDIGAFGIGQYLFQKPNGMNNPHLSNTQAIKGHTDYTNDIISLQVDSTYRIALYQVLKSATHADAKITLFIDYNNSHSYDPPFERVLTAYTTADSFFLTSSITIPHDSVVLNRLTGMRLVINNNTAPNSPSDDGCGVYTSGETQDFVVLIHDTTSAGVGNINSLHDLLMFPNPTNGVFKLQFNTSEIIKNIAVRVSNITGQTILANKYNNTSGEFATELNLSDQPRGIYFVEIIADGQRNMRKLIVE